VLSTSQFWLVGIIMISGLLPGWGVLSNYMPIFNEITTNSNAAKLTSLASLIYSLGRLFGGNFSDLVGTKNAIRIVLAVECVFMSVLPYSKSNLMFLIFIMIFVFSFGSVKVMFASLSAFVGPENINLTLGIMSALLASASLFGPLLISELKSLGKEQEYYLFFHIAGAVPAIGFLCTFFLFQLENSRERVDSDSRNP